MLTRAKGVATKITKVATISNLKELFFGERSTIKGRVFKNFAWLLTSNFASRFIRALITIYAAHVLGAEGYGIFSYVLGLAGFFVFFKNVGLDSILTREVAKNPEKQHNYFSTAFWMEVVLVAITVLAVVFIAPFFSKIQIAVSLLPLAAIILAFDDFRDFFFGYFRGKEKMELEAITVIVSNISIALFGYLALHYFKTPLAFLVAYATASILGAVVAAILLRPHVSGIIKNFERGLVRPIVTSALPIAMSGLMGVFLFSIDMVMLGWWRTPYEIGLYSAAQKTVGILSLVSGLIGTATFPILSRFIHTEVDKARIVFESSTKAIFLTSIPFVVGGVVLSKALIHFIFGSAYLNAAPVFSILILSILGMHPLVVFVNLVFAFDKQAKLIKYVVVSSLCNALFSFLLIPQFGIIGAAISIVITSLVYLWLLWRFAKTFFEFEILPKLGKIVVSAILMGIVAFVFQLVGVHVLINILLSGLFYFILLYILREDSIEQILSIVRPRI